MFAFVPPPHYYGGWGCFGVSLFFIGLVTAIVEQVATLFGCALGLSNMVTAITFVALGRGLHSSTSQLNLSRLWSLNH